MSEEQRAADLEAQYVQEYSDTEEVLEGLDPDLPAEHRSVEQVQGAAADAATEDEVADMAGDDRS